MIPVNELRVGNWILYKDTEIVEFDLDDFTELDQNNYFINLIKPIPLSEQWLKDFGFKLSDDKFNGLQYYYIDYDTNYIIVVEERLLLYGVIWWNYLGHTMMIREADAFELEYIETVHHLQNVFKDLPKIELTKQ